MERIKLHDKFFRLFIPNNKIEKAIKVTAEKINKDFASCNGIPIFVSILNGSFMFTASLMKDIDFSCEITFIKLESYFGTSSTGKIKEILGLSRDIRDRKVIVLEDIIDSGKTITSLCKKLREAGAADIKIATMFFKPDAYKGNEKIDYKVMNIGNEFIIGFGLDYDQLGRQYKDIYIIEE